MRKPAGGPGCVLNRVLNSVGAVPRQPVPPAQEQVLQRPLAGGIAKVSPRHLSCFLCEGSSSGCTQLNTRAPATMGAAEGEVGWGTHFKIRPPNKKDDAFPHGVSRAGEELRRPCIGYKRAMP